MKGIKVVCVVGILYLLMMLSVVFMYDAMLAISNKQGLPTDELAQMRGTIMNIALYSFVVLGVLFAALLMGLIYQVFRLPSQRPEDVEIPMLLSRKDGA